VCGRVCVWLGVFVFMSPYPCVTLLLSAFQGLHRVSTHVCVCECESVCVSVLSVPSYPLCHPAYVSMRPHPLASTPHPLTRLISVHKSIKKKSMFTIKRKITVQYITLVSLDWSYLIYRIIILSRKCTL